MATDQTAAEPPSTGSTIFENSGSTLNSRRADRKLVAENTATSSRGRSWTSRFAATVSTDAMGVPFGGHPG
ncbi:MAG: hypothetical protein WDM86_12905 [Rhizomicrobium sp.]